MPRASKACLTRFRYSRLGIKGKSVTFTVRNVGRRTGRTIAELYVSIPSPGQGVVEPPRQLKGYRAVTLRRGRSARVRIQLDSQSFSYWDVRRTGWAVPRGCFTIAVGRSSRDLPLHTVVAKGGARCG